MNVHFSSLLLIAIESLHISSSFTPTKAKSLLGNFSLHTILPISFLICFSSVQVVDASSFLLTCFFFKRFLNALSWQTLSDWDLLLRTIGHNYHSYVIIDTISIQLNLIIHPNCGEKEHLCYCQDHPTALPISCLSN